LLSENLVLVVKMMMMIKKKRRRRIGIISSSQGCAGVCSFQFMQILLL
jgi:hypothetical protein